MVEVPGSIPTKGNILLLVFFSFCFMREASDTNIAIFVSVKASIGGAK